MAKPARPQAWRHSSRLWATEPSRISGACFGADAGRPDGRGTGCEFLRLSGLTDRDQTLAGTGAYAGSQYDLEPPDQGLCVGNGYVMEAVNNAFTVYTPQGKRASRPTAFSEFFHVAPEYNPNAQPTTYGPLLSDPRCHFDADTQRWYITELEADQALLTGAYTGPTAVFVAVSQTANPMGAYSLYVIDTTDAGKHGHPGCPCLGDQPLLGADANGIYISTNEFPLFQSGFNGAQIYALSKRLLAAGLPSTIVHINARTLSTPDTGGTWYSVQPATSPASSQYDYSHNGTEFFLSSLQFFSDIPNDNRIAVWALTNTRSLDNVKPNVTLQHEVIPSVAYGQPPPAVQKPGPTPLGDSLGAPEEKLDSGDVRMMQVVYSGGRLRAGVTTAVRFGSQTTAGIAYFVVAPKTTADGKLQAHLTAGGYVAVRGQNVIYPSIGVNARGTPVMAFTLVGPNYFPSAAYVTDATGRPSNVRLAGPGAAPDDGVTGYSNPPPNNVARWGDYSAAVADPDGSIWFATEYIPNAPRNQYANWGTFIGHVKI